MNGGRAGWWGAGVGCDGKQAAGKERKEQLWWWRAFVLGVVERAAGVPVSGHGGGEGGRTARTAEATGGEQTGWWCVMGGSDRERTAWVVEGERAGWCCASVRNDGGRAAKVSGGEQQGL
eukprot:4430441-Pleurochrysis_carterae.AAC.1